MYKVRIWDLPTRLFHWLLVALVCGLVISAQVGGDAMQWHFYMGFAVLSLLLFRVVWGFVGGQWSRFGAFVVSPWQAWLYARGKNPHAPTPGHNPLGGYSVLAMLAVLLAQVASGLCSDDEIAAAGPLVAHVPGAVVQLATWYHAKVGKLVLIALVALHLAAILYHRLRHKDNLVAPMLHGDKSLPLPTIPTISPSRDDAKTRALALLIWACWGAGIAFLVSRLS